MCIALPEKRATGNRESDILSAKFDGYPGRVPPCRQSLAMCCAFVPRRPRVRCASSCPPWRPRRPATPAFESIRADALKGHVYFLSAPEMGGRDSLSLEGRIAANYIAGFFYRLGLKTVGEGGSYFQPFPMSEAAIDRAQTRLRATITAKSGGTTERNYVLGIGLHARAPGRHGR